MTLTAPPQGAAGVVLPTTAPPTPPLDHLSWSGVRTYSDCPRKFFYRYVEKAPEEFLPSALTFGHAIHHVIEGMYQSRLEGKDLPDHLALIDQYSQSWKEETQSGPGVKFGKDETNESLRELAVRMISALRSHVAAETENSTSTLIGIEHAIRFRLLAYAPPVEMRLDLVEIDGLDLVVTDWKSSRSSWNEAKVAESLPQLVVYAAGLVPLLKATGTKRIVTKFLVVTKGKTPKLQVFQPQPTQADVEKIKQRISDTWIAIQSGHFLPRESWQCAQCQFQKRCRGN